MAVSWFLRQACRGAGVKLFPWVLWHFVNCPTCDWSVLIHQTVIGLCTTNMLLTLRTDSLMRSRIAYLPSVLKCGTRNLKVGSGRAGISGSCWGRSVRSDGPSSFGSGRCGLELRTQWIFVWGHKSLLALSLPTSFACGCVKVIGWALEFE